MKSYKPVDLGKPVYNQLYNQIYNQIYNQLHNQLNIQLDNENKLAKL